jgi:hypothetical protein
MEARYAMPIDRWWRSQTASTALPQAFLPPTGSVEQSEKQSLAVPLLTRGPVSVETRALGEACRRRLETRCCDQLSAAARSLAMAKSLKSRFTDEN